ncbi:MAG: 16S rRNA (guanine(966)-N(2))-methyltransferase RsmD [Pseudomonadota bacterium]
MRVIGGKFRGKNLKAPKGLGTRPTTDRVRENVFNIIENRKQLGGLRVLDLFAGSGALGIEAISRGAGFCLFVEENTNARATIRQNVEGFGLTGQTKVFRRDAIKMGSIGTMIPFDLVFADPPYGMAYGQKAARSLVEGQWLVDNAMFILEEKKSEMPENIEKFSTIDTRVYGDTAIGIFEYGNL